MPLHGNGFYCDAVVNELLLENSIKLDNIKYQIKSSKSKPPDFFQDFVHSVANVFHGYKLANNGFIGLLAKNYITNNKHYFTTDRTRALTEWLKNPEEVSFLGLYGTAEHQNQFTMTETLVDKINKAMDNPVEPMVWMINKSKKHTLYNNALPIHRKVYDVSNMLVYKKHMSIMYKNPTAELVRVKVDLLGYVNVTEEIELDDNKWGEMKREWLPPKPNTTLWDKTAMTRTARYTINTKQWNIHKRVVLDDDDIKSLLKHGGLIHGMAGTGKSTALKQIKNALQKDV